MKFYQPQSALKKLINTISPPSPVTLLVRRSLGEDGSEASFTCVQDKLRAPVLSVVEGKSNGHKGFSLIELIIVLSLLLLITTLTLPSFWFFKRQLVASQAEKLHMVFNYMQQSAISCNKNLSLKFSNNSYSYDQYQETLPVGVIFGIKPGAKGPPAFPSHKINSPISFVGNQVTFFSTGQIQPGTVYLIDSEKNYLYAVTVPVSQVSFIRKYRYESNKWQLL